MASSRLLLLRRGDHDSRLTEGFESLLDMESMCDVSITCGQYMVKAHRTVLSIFSPFFKRIFDSIDNPLHYPFVVIKDMPYADLRAIIDLMYRGEVTVAQDQFGSLKKSAKTLEVSELSDIITSYEEKMDTKPKIDFEDSTTSSGRNTRKRGRPKRYCEESDDDLKSFQTPNKRQILQSRQSAQSQMIQKQTSKGSNLVKKPLVQKTANRYTDESPIVSKPQTATRGGHHPFPKQPTAIRGGHSAFRPQTATRGGHGVGFAKIQTATRGYPKLPARGGRGGRLAAQTAVKTVDESYSAQESTPRRGRRGRPPRHSRDSESDLPLATSLPVSLPEPVQVDLGNIFPNYNLNDVTPSTSNNISIPVTFEPTIKREPDSDSEVECIMSGSSPLPSGVVGDNAELGEPQPQNSYDNEVSASTSLQPIEIPANSDLTNENIDERSVRETNTSLESAINHSINSPLVIRQTESSQFQSNIIIKTERDVSPLNETIGEETHESNISSVVDSNIHSTNTGISPSITSTALRSESRSDPIAMTTPTIISVNTEVRESINSGTNAPIIRFIKTERISPPVVEETFESFAFSSNQTDSNLIDSNQASNAELEVTSQTSDPVIRRIKVERLSPTVVHDEIDVSEEISQSFDESPIVTSSRDNEPNVEMSTSANTNQLIEDPNDIECTYSGGQPIIRSIKVERNSPNRELDQINIETNSDKTEYSSSGQLLSSANHESIEMAENQVRNDDNLIDVQAIAFDCFFSNEEQAHQMQTFTSEATTSFTNSSSETNNHQLPGANSIHQSHVHNDHQNVNQSPTFDYTTNTVRDSSIQSDELLLESPQRNTD